LRKCNDCNAANDKSERPNKATASKSRRLRRRRRLVFIAGGAKSFASHGRSSFEVGVGKFHSQCSSHDDANSCLHQNG
ncbi:MAG: hypothetical protein ABWZ80_08170, partial [Beijerinckiaceae bacterium]